MDKLYKSFGVVFDQILDKIGITKERAKAKRELSTVLIEMFREEVDISLYEKQLGRKVEKKRDLDKRHMAKFIDFILMYYARERGWFLESPNEQGSENKTLTEYLNGNTSSSKQ